MKAARLFHFIAIVILLAWASVMLYFYASGRVNNLLVGHFRIGPLFAGLGFTIVAMFNLFTTKVAAACNHEHHHHEEDDTEGHVHEEGHDHHHKHGEDCCHGHSHDHDHDEHHHDQDEEHIHTHDDQTVPGVFATLFIVLIPAIGAAALSQDGFSIDTLANKGLFSNDAVMPGQSAPAANLPAASAVAGAEPAAVDPDAYTLADLEQQVRKSPEGNFLIPIPSLYYSAADQELANVLLGQRIETTGQVVKEIAENDPNGTRMRFYRLFVSCCLADARPIGFSIDFGKEPPTFSEDSWAKVVGKMTYPEKDGRPIPILEVESIEAIPEPEDMMY